MKYGRIPVIALRLILSLAACSGGDYRKIRAGHPSTLRAPFRGGSPLELALVPRRLPRVLFNPAQTISSSVHI